MAGAVLELMNLPVYNTELLANGTYVFDDTYSVYLEDDSYGEVSIIDHGDDFYSIHGDLKKGGRTTLTLVSPDGAKTVFDLKIEKRTYEMTEKK